MSSFNPQLSEAEKERGNSAIKQQNYRQAISHYTNAIRFNSMNSTIFFNRALAFIKLCDYQLAVNDCNKALELDKEYFKCYERRAQAFFGLKDYSKATNDAIRVLQVEPNRIEIREILLKSQGKLKKRRKEINMQPNVDLDSEDEDFIDENLILFDSSQFVDKQLRTVEKVCGQVSQLMKQGNYEEVIEKSLDGIHSLSELFTHKNNKIQKVKLVLAKKVIKSHVILMHFDQAFQFISSFRKLESEDIKDELFSFESSIYELQGNFQESLKALKKINSFNKNIPVKHQRLNFFINPVQPRIFPSFQGNLLDSSLARWTAQKETVNTLFKSERFEESIEEFDKIINAVHQKYSEFQVLTDNRLKDLVVKLLNNKAIAYSKIGNFHKSIKECLKVFQVDSKNAKAAFCLGKNLKNLKFLESAKMWMIQSLAKNELKFVKDEIDSIEKYFVGIMQRNGFEHPRADNCDEKIHEGIVTQMEQDKSSDVGGGMENIEKNIKKNNEVQGLDDIKHMENECKEKDIISEVQEIDNFEKNDEKEELIEKSKEVLAEINENKEPLIEETNLNQIKTNQSEKTEPFYKDLTLTTQDIYSKELPQVNPPEDHQKLLKPILDDPTLTQGENRPIPNQVSKPTEDSILLSESPAKSQSIPPNTQSTHKKYPDLSLAKKFAEKEYESHFQKDHSKHLISNLSSLINSKSLISHLKEIPASDYSSLTPHMLEIFPSLLNELSSSQLSSDPWLRSFLSFAVSGVSFQKNLKFLSKAEKNHLNEILTRIGDESLLKLVNN